MFYRLLIKPSFQGLRDLRGHREKRAPWGRRGSKARKEPGDYEGDEALKEKKDLWDSRDLPAPEVTKVIVSP